MDTGHAVGCKRLRDSSEVCACSGPFMKTAASRSTATEKFWHRVKEHFFTGSGEDLAYGQFIDLGVECGLLRIVSYDPAAYRVTVVSDPMPADAIYVVEEP